VLDKRALLVFNVLLVFVIFPNSFCTFSSPIQKRDTRICTSHRSLRANVQLNNLESQITVFEQPVTRVKQNVTMNHCEDNSLVASISYDKFLPVTKSYSYLKGNSCDQKITIESLGWETDILPDSINGRKINFLKLDCEGCEYDFLESIDFDSIDVITGECHWLVGISKERVEQCVKALRVKTFPDRPDVKVVK